MYIRTVSLTVTVTLYILISDITIVSHGQFARHGAAMPERRKRAVSHQPKGAERDKLEEATQTPAQVSQVH